jgi:L-alanine-DL-glutamate epimerase-like enolase superfamily enzyme
MDMTNMLHLSHRFAQLICELCEKGIDRAVYPMTGDGGGLYVSIEPESSFYNICILDNEGGLQWVMWENDIVRESMLQPFVSLDDCLAVLDKVILWEASKQDGLYPGLEWVVPKKTNRGDANV